MFPALRRDEEKRDSIAFEMRDVVERSLKRPRVEDQRIGTAQEGAPEQEQERDFGWTGRPDLEGTTSRSHILIGRDLILSLTSQMSSLSIH